MTILLPALLATQAAALVAVSASPGTVAEFLVQADALIAIGGDEAVNSPEANAIRTSIQQAAMAYRATLAQAMQRGAAPTSCPPPPGKAQLSLRDITGDFRAFPETTRSMPLEQAFALVMTLRFPCAGTGQ